MNAFILDNTINSRTDLGLRITQEILPSILQAKTIYFSNDSDVFYNIKTAQATPMEQKMVTLYEFALTFNCSLFRVILIEMK
jgi:hypothetical protein